MIVEISIIKLRFHCSQLAVKVQGNLIMSILRCRGSFGSNERKLKSIRLR